MSEPTKPSYIPDSAERWTMVTLGTGERVEAWVDGVDDVLVRDPRPLPGPWRWTRLRGFGWSVSEYLTLALSDQCRRLYEATGTGYVDTDEPEHEPLTEPYDGELEGIAERVLSETPYRRRDGVVIGGVPGLAPHKTFDREARRWELFARVAANGEVLHRENQSTERDEWLRDALAHADAALAVYEESEQ